MSFQARCDADFWLAKCLEVTIKGLGGTAAICLKAGATPLQRERLPNERDICHVTSISPGCGVSPLPFMHLPPHLNTPKMLLCLQVLWKMPPLEPASLGGVKGLKVVLVLKKKEELYVLVASISLELYEVKSESFSLQLLCVHLCPFLAFPIRHHQPPAQREAGRCVQGHAKSSFARLVPWHLDAIQWACTGNPVGNTSRDNIDILTESVHAACSLKYRDFTCSGQIQMKHVVEKDEFVLTSHRGVFSLWCHH